MLAWAMLTIFTGVQFGYAAWGVGLITGGMARLFARQGSTLQGLVCAGCAVLGILGGQYFAAKYVFSLFTLLWLLLGVASAYKIGSGNDG